MNRLTRALTARRTTARDTALVHRVAGLLLDYPTEELRTMLPHLRAAAEELAGPLREPLEELIERLGSRPLTELQADYVETFDLRRRCSLYLTYYSHGDTRKRGVALVEFKQAYRDLGFVMADDDPDVTEELPDHLAVVLEFSSAGDDAQEAGLRLLLAHRAGLETLRLALVDAGSPYAHALTAVCATLPPLAGDDREAVARLVAEGPPGEEVGLEPFGPPASPGSPAAAPGPVPLPMPGVRR